MPDIGLCIRHLHIACEGHVKDRVLDVSQLPLFQEGRSYFTLESENASKESNGSEAPLWLGYELEMEAPESFRECSL